MNDFLAGLYDLFAQENQAPVGEPEYEQAIQAYIELEEQVKEKIGPDLLTRYQRAQYQVSYLENVAIFTCGLRFGAQFALAAIAPQSSQTSIP